MPTEKRSALLHALLAFCLAFLPGTLLSAHVVSNASAQVTGISALATAVWGQPDFVSSNCHHATAFTLCGPTQAAVDTHGNLWVADFAANRVVMYRPGSTVASK